MQFTKRAKIITTIALAATLATGGGFMTYQKNAEAQAIQAAKVEKLKAEDNKERKEVQVLKDKLATTDRAGLAKLKDEAKTVKDPARKTQLTEAIKEATVRLDKADKAAAEKKAAEKRAEDIRKAKAEQAAKDARRAEVARQAEAQAEADRVAQAERDAAKAQAVKETETAQPEAPVQAPAAQIDAAPATPSTPTHTIAGFSSVPIASSQAFIDNSRYSWISISDIPTAGGTALLGHADAAGAWVAGANVGDYVTVSGVRYQIYNKYIVGWNSPGEWDAIQSCASGEVSIITCTDASGQTNWVLRARTA